MKTFAKSRENIQMNSIRDIMNIAEEMSDVIPLQIGEPAVQTPGHIKR
ncbi:aspartate/methionine/tyrosine aminotransferase [Geomicrobium halophilum]|uniref:Aspartate/methionine/tyrosine aminotransferase n=1 Tax=Geomicrobium halophilum TaxID=549000 RepID=A0A841PIM6_9BACL|nr:hypothetical protein [Geomicrobium halophilum]MBB6448650.1 aspartate/methionine/tyrosine aminotransferase [Geomicrobium halophilum]